MAEKKTETKESPKKESTYQLKVLGPKHKISAQVLGFETSKKDRLEFVPGQVLSVGSGGDLTKSDATRLQNTTTWNFERVND